MNQDGVVEMLRKIQVNLGRSGCGSYQDGSCVSTTFSDFDFWYTVSGKFTLQINKEEYVAHRGDAFLMAPGTTLTLRSSGYSEQQFCHFVPQYLGSHLLRGEFQDHRISPRHYHLLQALSQMLMEADTRTPLTNTAVESVLKILLCDMIDSQAVKQSDFFLLHPGADLEQMSRILEYIHRNAHMKLSNRELAAQVGFNESYFSRYFKKHMGVSPKQYILKSRMEYAKNLLGENGLSVKETALTVGFTDQSAFSKTFKNMYGIAPSAFKDVQA